MYYHFYNFITFKNIDMDFKLVCHKILTTEFFIIKYLAYLSKSAMKLIWDLTPP